jgi:hypothetical protein
MKQFNRYMILNGCVFMTATATKIGHAGEFVKINLVKV